MADDPVSGQDPVSTFGKTNLKMLEDQLLCDVIFETGGQRIGAHKFILASRNSVFRYKFIEAPAENYFHLGDHDPETVWTFFRFIYTGDVDITVDSAKALSDIAEEFQAEELIAKCLPILFSSITPESVCLFLKKYHKFGFPDIIQNCVNYIVDHSHILFTPSLESLPEPCLQAILESEDLHLEENDICDIAFKWAESECSRNNINPTGENLRKILGDVFNEIRFPIMDKDYFVGNIPEKNILTAEEETKILRFFISPKSTYNLPFKAYKRGNKPKEVIIRFLKENKGWAYRSERKDAICFVLSTAITIHGIKVYGGCEKAGQLSASVLLQNDNGQVMSSLSTQLDTSMDKSMYDVLFNQPVTLNKNTEYHIICTFDGLRTYHGDDGQEAISNSRVEIKFMKSRFSTNKTDVKRGQIPGLLYTV